MNIEKLERKAERIGDVAASLDDAISGFEDEDDPIVGLLRLASSSLYDIKRDIEDFIKENKKEEK